METTSTNLPDSEEKSTSADEVDGWATLHSLTAGLQGKYLRVVNDRNKLEAELRKVRHFLIKVERELVLAQADVAQALEDEYQAGYNSAVHILKQAAKLEEAKENLKTHAAFTVAIEYLEKLVEEVPIDAGDHRGDGGS